MKKGFVSMLPWRLAWLGLTVATLWCALLYGSSVALAFAGALISIPLISVPMNWYLSKKLQLSFSGQSSALEKNAQGHLMLCMAKESILPILRLRVRVCVENKLTGQKADLWINSAFVGKGKQELPIEIGSNYSGRLKIMVKNYYLYDVFGLIGIRRKGESVTHVTVQPHTFETVVAFRPGADLGEDSEIYSNIRPGYDLSEPFQLREYVPGDSPRQIHWKLSGKLDRLIVRDPSEPITPRVLLFWERTGESSDPQIIDTQAEVILSLCRALTDQSIPFTLGWNDTERNLCLLHEIRDPEELAAVIPRLMEAKGKAEGISGAELLLQQGGQCLCAHMVYLAETPQKGIEELEQYGSLTKLICGETHDETELVFNAQNYHQILSYIEI